MILSGIILFVSALAGGLLIYLFPEQKGNGFRLSLIFAGAYLFSITIVHIIPEIYSHPSGGLNVGIFGGYNGMNVYLQKNKLND